MAAPRQSRRIAVSVARGRILGNIAASFRECMLAGNSISRSRPIPDATVTVANQSTGFTRTVQGDSSGAYLCNGIVSGLYSVSVEKAGFKKYIRTDLDLTASRKMRIDGTLELGQMTQTITVKGETPLICAFGVAPCPLSGAAAFPAVQALAAPPQDNPHSQGLRRPNRGAVEKPQDRRAGLALHLFLRAFPCRFPGPDEKAAIIDLSLLLSFAF